MGSWNDNWNNSWGWFESNSLENKLSRVTKERDEISQKLKYIEEFLKLKGINSQDIQEYIDSRQVADKLAEEE